MTESVEPTIPIGAMPVLHGDAAAVREQTANLLAETKRQQLRLDKERADAVAEFERQKRDLEAQIHAQKMALEAQMAPLRDHLAKLTEVAWTMDLYLGRDADLQQVRDGQPAPADTPLHIRQRVLVMSEEAAILGLDFSHIEQFEEWLLADPANLDRVLPDQRGVVVLVPTRVKSKTGNIFEDTYRDEANKAPWWLIRNGEKLWLMEGDPKLPAHDHVLPLRDEFEQVFEPRLFGSWGEKRAVEPGSEEWLALEKRADAKRRHYMRIMLVLQGLIDHTPVWHPLPEGGINLMNVDAQWQGKVRLIQDGDKTLQLGTGVEPFADWQSRLNAMLRPGLRVVADWWRADSDDVHPSGCYSRPEKEVPHPIEDRRNGGLVVRFQRTDEVLQRNVPVPGKPGYVYPIWYGPARQRGSVLIRTTDKWVLPFDLATRAELVGYLESRDERSQHFLSLVPLLRAAIAAKDAEAEAEAPFRVLLSGALINAGADPNDTDMLLDELVTWWKVKNAWGRALNGDPAHEKKALDEIVAEYKVRANHDTDGDETMVAAGLMVAGVIAVGRNRQGKWFAYKPSEPAHDKGIFLDVYPILKSGKVGEPKLWQHPPVRSVSLLHIAYSTPEWEDWNHAANPRHYLTGPQREQLVADVIGRSEGRLLCVTEMFDPKNPGVRYLASYEWSNGDIAGTDIRVTSSPLSWHSEGHRDSDDRLVRARKYRVGRDGLEPARHHEIPSNFDHFTADVFDGMGVPWWPDDATRYATSDTRPRLVWADDAALADVQEWVERCRAADKANREESLAAQNEARRYAQPLLDAIDAKIDAGIRARFHVDYGYNAEDLWPAHLKSVRRPRSPHVADLVTLVMKALAAGDQIVGQPLGVVAARHNAKIGHLEGFEDVMIPEPEPEPE